MVVVHVNESVKLYLNFKNISRKNSLAFATKQKTSQLALSFRNFKTIEKWHMDSCYD